MKRIIYVLAATILFLIAGNENVFAEAEKLSVNITTYEGETVMMSPDAPLWSAVPVRFAPVPVGGRLYYSISTDDGENFGGNMEMDSESVVLYPDDPTSSTGRWMIRFISVDENEEQTVSDTYSVNFDISVPTIEFMNEEAISKAVEPDTVLNFTIRDEGGGISRIVPKCNGNVINEEHFADGVIPNEYDLAFSILDTGESVNKVELLCIDLAGNSSLLTFEYRCDTKAPKISAEGIEDGAKLNEPAELRIIATDDSDEVCTDYVIEREMQDQMVTTEVSGASQEVSLRFEEAGKYRVTMSATDGAGNRSDEIHRSFIIDPVAPEVDITGVSESADNRSAASINIDVCDDLWENTEVDINLTRNAADKSEYIPISSYNLAAARDIRTVNINSDGEYILEVEAKDGAGNASKETKRFRIDANAPRIAVGGAADGDITAQIPTLRFMAAELFYESTIMTALLEKKDNTGYTPVSKIDKVMKSVEDCIEITPDGEGEYRLTCSASDRSGNSSETTMNFCIDHTPPVIAGMSDIDNRFFSAFALPKKLAEMVRDRFNVKAYAYVNDDEFGENDRVITEGKYVLSILAEDEAGNVAEDSATFIVDHTAPQIVIKGFDRNGNIKKGSFIEVGLAEDSDRLLSVRFADRNILIGDDNTAGIAVDDYGEYNLEVKAEDPAGNITDTVIHTSCYMQGGLFSNNTRTEKIITPEIVENDNPDPDIARLAIGIISVLSGTYGLTYRASLRGE